MSEPIDILLRWWECLCGSISETKCGLHVAFLFIHLAIPHRLRPKGEMLGYLINKDLKLFFSERENEKMKDHLRILILLNQ